MRRIKLCFKLLVVGILVVACGQKTQGGKNGTVQNIEVAESNKYEIGDTGSIDTNDLSKQVDEICMAYNNKEITYEEANGYLQSALETAPAGEKQAIINKAISVLKTINTSKSAYEAGIKDMDKEDISYKVDAIKQFQKVIEEDTNYEMANTYLDELSEEYYTYMVGIANEHIATGNYVEALQTYDEIIELIGNYDDCESEIENIEYDYIDAAIAEAENDMSEGKFTEADNCIDKCINRVGTNTALETEKQRIEEFTPISLMELTSLCEDSESSDINVDEWEETDFTNLGESGFSGIKIANYGAMNKKVTISYIIDGKYDTFTGQFALHEDSKNKTDSEYYGAILGICGDDVMLYKSEQLYGGILPMDLSVDITGVNRLDIIFFSGCKFDFTMSNVFKFGLLNPQLKKIYVPLANNGNTDASATEEKTSDVDASGVLERKE